MRAWPGPGAPGSRSRHSSTSGPPVRETTMAFMRRSLPCTIVAARFAQKREREMSKRAFAFLSGALLLASAAVADEMKTYQVTGPVVSVSSDSIVVKKGKDNWTLAKDASTKDPGVKAG